MKIFTAAQVRQWDQYTITQEPIASAALMERAAAACFDWLEKQGYLDRQFSVFCGKGNNGGDGMVIARMLNQAKVAVTVYIPDLPGSSSPGFRHHLQLLQQTPVSIHYLDQESALPPIPQQDVVIECLFGTGLNRAIDGKAAALISYLNACGNEIIAIDMPAGLFADQPSMGPAIIRATHTLSFQVYKTAFMIPENETWIGQVHVLSIGLSPAFEKQTDSTYELIDMPMIRSRYRPRNRFAHKGNFGHALLMAGSYGKMGAALLAAHACLRSGAGLLTIQAPACGDLILQTGIPEAMLLADQEERMLTQVPDSPERFTTIGIGPGIGTTTPTAVMLAQLLTRYERPMIFDADALNILAGNPALLSQLPAGSILTPHPKEFERLFGQHANSFDRLNIALEQAAALDCIIILKGHHSFIALPDGKGYFNNTGNPGMAKGGSGDVLTGILTGLLAQGYSSADAAIMGVYLHGLAGDLAAGVHGTESMLPSDLIAALGHAFRQLLTA